MDNDTCKLSEMGGLYEAEKKLISTTGKSLRPGGSDAKCDSFDFSQSEDDADKENRQFHNTPYRDNPLSDSSDDDFEQFLTVMATPQTKTPSQKPSSSTSTKKERIVHNTPYRNNALSDSSDDDFEQFFIVMATPRTKTSSQKPSSSTKKKRIVTLSSDSDGSFETFLIRAKTPNVKPRTKTRSESEVSIKNFIVGDSSSDDDFIRTKSSSRVPKNTCTPSTRHPLRRPLLQCDSPAFDSDSDDEDGDNSMKKSTALHGNDNCSPSMAAKQPPWSTSKTSNIAASEVNSNGFKRTFSAPSKLDELSSSEEEFSSIIDSLKKKNKLPGSISSPPPSKDMSKKPVVIPNPLNRIKSSGSILNETTPSFVTPSKPIFIKPTISKTEPRHWLSSRVQMCKTPGCFLKSLSNPGTTYGRNFKKNKEELISRLFELYNTSVFENKLPATMSVTWNKRLWKTAGYCFHKQEQGGARSSRIELSEKLCDSADRVRDTLIHEMCHAAVWLIHGVRDGHGNFWRLYARKSTIVHPELPMVTRCHDYDIKYKFQYQCTSCQNMIGRHSKSLDTERFACDLCAGRLVLLNPSTPRPLTPFANFVKENYRSVRQALTGQSHGEVMRKLSADFALKTKLSQN